LKRREWRKRQKKKKKMKVGHFGKKISKGVRLEFFLQIGSEKKKSMGIFFSSGETLLWP